MTSPPDDKAAQTQPHLEPAEGRGLFRRVWTDYIAPQGGRLWLAFAFMALYAIATAAYLFVIQRVIDGANSGASIEDYARLVLPVLIGIPLINGVSNYLQRVITNRIALTAVAGMQRDMFDASLRADLSTLSQEPTGGLISRFVSDIQVVSGGLIRVIGNLVRDVLSVIFLIIAMLWQNWQVSALLLAALLALIPLKALSDRMRGSARDAQSHVGTITAQLKESYDGARLVRAYGLEDRERERLNKSFTRRIELFQKLVSQQARVDPIIEIFGGVAIAAVVIGGVWLLRADLATAGEIAAVLAGLLILFPRIRALGTMNNVVQEMSASLTRIFDLADRRSKLTEAPDAKALMNPRGAVELCDVYFTYPDGTAALQGVSIKAAPGERIALVGPSGGGKSTVLNLVPRLFDVTAGAVLIDGQDVRALTLASLREHIALVSQSVTLFSDTIAENIRMGRADASHADIEAAAKAAAAHDFIMALPEGYDTPLGEAGETLSGGQRQRLSIARAILRDAPILLLDEATSALDSESEAKVKEALDRLAQGRTTLTIAHRLSTISGADRIYVIEDGRVTEQGTEAQLKRKKGVFARLKALQS